ncbi:MAG: class E sortase [Acidimicrobiales bacterium]|nr:class E sortase [Acidimicrobiales bacterium]
MVGRILGFAGRLLVATGVIVLLFVVYQLWGTGLQEARSQQRLEQQFKDLQASVEAGKRPVGDQVEATPPLRGDPASPAGAPAGLPRPTEGDPVAIVRIPSIGVTRTIVEGITVAQLRRGPGHYPETPLPGQAGNVAIAGHRTTYGQPFHNIDKLAPGDEIRFETLQGDFTYVVAETRIVEPTQVEVLDDYGDDRVTLIACEPKYSAAKRIIVVGNLIEDPAPPLDRGVAASVGPAVPSAPLPGETIDGVGSGAPGSAAPAAMWGALAAGAWASAWLASRFAATRSPDGAEWTADGPTKARRAVRWIPYVLALPASLVALYFCFQAVDRMLPGAY